MCSILTWHIQNDKIINSIKPCFFCKRRPAKYQRWLLALFAESFPKYFYKRAFCINWYNHVFFLNLLTWWIDLFSNIGPVLHSWNKTHLVAVCNYFYIFLDVITYCWIDFNIFVPVYEGYQSIVFFLWDNAGLKMNWELLLLFSGLWKTLYKIGVNSLNVWKTSVKPCAPGYFFFKRF